MIEQKICPKCRSEIHIEATVCPHCKSKITPLVTRAGCATIILLSCFLYLLIENSDRHYPSGAFAKVAQTVEDPTITPVVETPRLWDYQENTDKIENKNIYFASIESETILNFSFPYSGKQRATLILRKKQNAPIEILLGVDKGQFVCNSYNCEIIAKIDNNKPITMKGVLSSTQSTKTIFLQPEAPLYSQIKTGKSLIIRATFYQEPMRDLEFNIENLDINRIEPRLNRGSATVQPTLGNG